MNTKIAGSIVTGMLLCGIFFPRCLAGQEGFAGPNPRRADIDTSTLKPVDESGGCADILSAALQQDGAAMS